MAEYRLSYTGEQVDALLGQINNAIPITYSQLKNLRDGAKLAPGKFYRITDYVTTTSDPESRSVGHQFDVIVLALDESHLSEESYAAHHEGDSYFANYKLDAWRLMYCLDNDLTRFGWADTTNGRGVIHRMVDEFENDLPYDFKNIQFKRYAVTSKPEFATSLARMNGLRVGINGGYGYTIDSSSYYWYYTFSLLGNSFDSCTDASLNHKAFSNTFKPYILGNVYVLLNNVFMTGDAVFAKIDDFGLERSSEVSAANRNVFGYTCYMNTVLGGLDICESEACFRRNLFIGEARHTIFKSDSQDNTVLCGDFCFNTTMLYENVIYVPVVYSGNNYEYFGKNYVHVNGKFQNNRGRRIEGNTFMIETYTEYAVWANNFGIQFYENTIRASYSYNSNQYTTRDNTFNGAVIGCSVLCLQYQHNESDAQLTCVVFHGAVEYIEVPENGGQSFSFNYVGPIRGTSSSHIKLGNANFYCGLGGVKRRVNIEGDVDGEIVATWKGSHGSNQGVYATVAESRADTWHAI